MIHIITGSPCSGKSTYVEENAKDGDLVIDFDKIATALGASVAHGAEGIIRDAAFKARDGAIETALKRPDEETWIIHTTPTEKQMESYKEVGAEFVHLDPGEEECLARARRENRPDRVIDAIHRYYSERKGIDMEHKYKSFELKTEDAGKIEGYFSTFDRIPDAYGDVIAPGAFTETIKAREESGHPFPLCWNHDLNQIIGKVDEFKEDEKGQWMSASFFDTPLAQEKRAIVGSGVVYQFSFAYDVVDAGEVTLEDGTKANELRQVNLFEVSIVPIPANPRAEVTDIKSKEVNPETDIKSKEVKSGRRNSAKDAEDLRNAIILIQRVLGEIDEPEETNSEDETEVNEASEERKSRNEDKDKLLEYIGGLTNES